MCLAFQYGLGKLVTLHQLAGTMMSTLTFKQKLWIPLVCSLACLIAISVFAAFASRQLRIEERKNELAHVVDMAMSGVRMYADRASSGQMSTEQAKQQSLMLLSKLRYAKDGYVSVVDAAGISVMNPMKPETNGKNMWDFQDTTGKFLFRDIVAAGASEAGSGFVAYWWPRPGQKDLVPKLSRVAGYKPWGWNVLSGLYMDDIELAFKDTLVNSGMVLLLAAAILAVIMVLLNRNLHKSLGGDPAYTNEIATRIAAGDLTMDVAIASDTEGSILCSMRTMQHNLASTLATIRTSAETIAVASSEIAGGNQELSSRTESQSLSLEETTKSMRALTAKVTLNAESAVQANAMVRETSEMAQQGGRVVAEVVQTMEVIDTSSKKIVDIISVIDGIAFQTNILALNAAVEAARAGEQGRGFAVVASEVRNLAQRSATAAKEIKQLITNSVQSIDVGNELVLKAGATMEKVLAGVAQVAQVMATIETASGQQSDEIRHVNHAIASLESVTHQNAALVEEAAAAAASLQDQADQMTTLVARFKLAGAPPRPASRALAQLAA